MGKYFWAGPTQSDLQKTATTLKNGEDYIDAYRRKFSTAKLRTRESLKHECSIRGIDTDIPGFLENQMSDEYQNAVNQLAERIYEVDMMYYPPKDYAGGKRPSGQKKDTTTTDQPRRGSARNKKQTATAKRGPNRKNDADSGADQDDEETSDADQEVNKTYRTHHSRPVTAGKRPYFRPQSTVPGSPPPDTQTWIGKAQQDATNAASMLRGWAKDPDRTLDRQIHGARDVMSSLMDSYKAVGSWTYSITEEDPARLLPSPKMAGRQTRTPEFVGGTRQALLHRKDWPDRYPIQYDESNKARYAPEDQASKARYMPNWTRTEDPTWRDFEEASKQRGFRVYDVHRAFAEDSTDDKRDRDWAKGLKTPLDEYGRRGWQCGLLSAEMARRGLYHDPTVLFGDGESTDPVAGETGTSPCKDSHVESHAAACNATMLLLNYEIEGATRRFGGTVLNAIQKRVDALKLRFHEDDGGCNGNTSDAGFKLPVNIEYPRLSPTNDVDENSDRFGSQDGRHEEDMGSDADSPVSPKSRGTKRRRQSSQSQHSERGEGANSKAPRLNADTMHFDVESEEDGRPRSERRRRSSSVRFEEPPSVERDSTSQLQGSDSSDTDSSSESLVTGDRREQIRPVFEPDEFMSRHMENEASNAFWQLGSVPTRDYPIGVVKRGFETDTAGRRVQVWKKHYLDVEQMDTVYPRGPWRKRKYWTKEEETSKTLPFRTRVAKALALRAPAQESGQRNLPAGNDHGKPAASVVKRRTASKAGSAGGRSAGSRRSGCSERAGSMEASSGASERADHSTPGSSGSTPKKSPRRS